MILTYKQQKHPHYHQVKIDKYEFLTGGKIQHPDQKRVIKQANFPYSHLGKMFEKQIKTIEIQGEKQVKVIEEHGKQLASNTLVEKYSSPPSKQKGIFYELFAERIDAIEKLQNNIYFEILTYRYKGPTVNVNFNNFIDAASLFSEIRSSRIKVANAEKDQIDFKSKLSYIGMRGKN